MIFFIWNDNFIWQSSFENNFLLKLTLSEHPNNKLKDCGNETGSNLNNVPKVHERKAEEEAEGAAELGNQRFQSVDQFLCLEQHVGRSVPNHKLRHLLVFLKIII